MKKKLIKSDDTAAQKEEAQVGLPEEQLPAAEAAETEKKEKHGKRGTVGLVVAIICAVLALLFALASFGGYKVTESELILPNVYANGISIGGMTEQQAAELLSLKGFDRSAEGRMRVKLPGGVVFRLNYDESGAKLGSAETAHIAYAYGHDGNWYSNLIIYIRNFLAPVDVVYFDKTLNYEYINSGMEEAIARFMRNTADNGPEVDLEKGEIRLLKGAGQLSIDKELLYKKIVDALLAGKESLSFPLGNQSITVPDFEAMAEEMNVEASDASFDENFEIKPSVTGVHLDAEEALRLWDEGELGRVVAIPIAVTEPEISTEMLSDMLFRDKLGSQTTYFNGSSSNRINNIRLASDAINGLIMMPGDVFSYNGQVGERTEEKGYKPAGAYMNGAVVDEVGGGICQVSSTLYCAAMLAQMETVERTCHYFLVSYLSPGLDATVSWPDTDYKFKNSREYPVKIVSICDEDNKSITIEIWGTNVDGSYVELSYGVGTWFDEEFTEVAVGKTAVTYRNIYDKDGNRIETIREGYSAYHYHDYEIQWPEPEEDDEVETTPEEGEGGTEGGGTGAEGGEGTGGETGGEGTGGEGTGGETGGDGGGGSGDNGGNMEDEDGNITFG